MFPGLISPAGPQHPQPLTELHVQVNVFDTEKACQVNHSVYNVVTRKGHRGRESTSLHIGGLA